MLAKNQIKYLKELGKKIDKRYTLGKKTIHKNFIDLVDKGLIANELVKVSLLNGTPESVQVAADTLVKELRCELVSKVGHTLLLYRMNPTRIRIFLPKAE